MLLGYSTHLVPKGAVVTLGYAVGLNQGAFESRSMRHWHETVP